MQNALLATPVLSSALSRRSPAARASSWTPLSSPVACADGEFIDLLEAYRGSGGLARAKEVRVQVARQHQASLAMLASWIVRRQVICFVWQTKMWLPLFQFDPSSMTPRTGLRDVLSELAPAYADWELAQWFVRPHPGLANRTPAAALAQSPNAVLNVARIDPHVMRH
jgi:hypothetical protein